MLSHGLVSSSIFLGAYIIYKAYSSRRLYIIKGGISILPIISLIWFISMRANMGVPPRINLQGEIILLRAFLKFSLVFSVPLGVSLFFGGAYRIFLYSVTQNGSVSEGFTIFGQVRYVDVCCMVMHLVPAFLLIVKGGVLVDWVI